MNNLFLQPMKKANHPRIQYLLAGIKLEEQAQHERFNIQGSGNLKQLKRDGLALHPIKVTRKTYGFAEYPEISFRVPLSQDTSSFRDSAAIEVFYENENAVKGILLNISGSAGELRLFAPDFPDWIEQHGVGIKLTPDTKTHEIIESTLFALDEGSKKNGYAFFNYLYNNVQTALPQANGYKVEASNKLNESQQNAVAEIASYKSLVIVHGPPGTGKTTTLVEAIIQLVKNGEKVLVTAPSNAATDHIALQLVKKGIATLRVGNQSKIHSELINNTVEGRLMQGAEQQQLKKLRIQAESFRKMAHQYKRNFGKDEREQRKLLMQEVKSIRNEIRSLQNFYTEKWINEAAVVCGTPVGLHDDTIQHIHFNTLIIDEAGQCLESLAWVAMREVQRVVLAGDHLQLPPTLISEEAIKKGYNKSFLEVAVEQHKETCLLDTQYRMRESIAAFSNLFFYGNKLKTPPHLKDITNHLMFYDTAGTGFQEEQGTENTSLSNSGELEIIQKLIAQQQIDISRCALISPYSGQVALAKEMFPKELRVSTVDSFQGQECEIVFISLVRSNDEGTLGFLTDYRRMNVAMTRAKEKLIVVGDSVTFGNDKFYTQFLNFCQENNAYFSAWELM